ncbi:MAG: hypothetical protein F4Y95_08930, partial [Chloroflexi bacterium]|nr:hypothetical protein [Chloroflexota bacterium]
MPSAGPLKPPSNPPTHNTAPRGAVVNGGCHIASIEPSLEGTTVSDISTSLDTLLGRLLGRPDMTLVPSDSSRRADAQTALRTAFAPSSIAIAGVSPRTTGWGGGQMFLRGIRNLNRVPSLYCLNPRGGELLDGTPLYQSLADVPGPVESLISAVPASAILGLIDDAIAKGVKVVHLFTAGFGETGSTERADLETEVLRRLHEAGIRMIGPNCMGLHSTRGGVSWMEEGSTTPGRVGMLSQSGMNASEVVGEGVRRGINFSNVASFG